MPDELNPSWERRGALGVLSLGLREWGVDAVITTRAGGVSEAPYDSLNLATHVGDDPHRVQVNRARLAAAMRVGPERLVSVAQVHSNEVLEVEGPVTGQADALVSSSRDLAVMVLVADCLPILLVDAAQRRVGVVHAGWRGLAAGVIAAAVERFEDPARVLGVVGPGISVRAYQVGPEVARHFSEVPGALASDHGDRSRLDLRVVALAQLAAAGLAAERVRYVPAATDGGARFFSDRASRPTGRFALSARVLA